MEMTTLSSENTSPAIRGILTRMHTEEAYDFVYAKKDVSLEHHMIETGEVCRMLLEETQYHALLCSLQDMTGESESNLKNFICYTVAMHDIGKAHPAFQSSLAGEKLEKLYEFGLIVHTPKHTIRHEQYSEKLMIKFFEKRGFDEYDAADLTKISGYHHQHKSETAQSFLNDFCGSSENKWMSKVIYPLEEEIYQRYPFEAFSLEPHVDSFCHAILGLLLTSDHLASSGVLKRNTHALDAVKMIKTNSISFQQLFPEFEKNGYTPYPVQQITIDEVKKDPGFDLMIIEAAMGSGKTEAGLFAAFNAMHAMKRQGIYVALPTTATAESLLPRVKAAVSAAGYDKEQVNLATGTAWLTQAENNTETTDTLVSVVHSKYLNHFACGTVDQIMSAVSAVRFNDMALSLLANKVLLIDEMHSYDAFMMSNLKTLFAYCREYHVPVIMLSATLSDNQKNEILSVYSKKFHCEKSSYPLVTMVRNGKFEEIDTDIPETNKRVVPETIRILGNIEKIAELALETVKDGGNTAVIINTVKRARAVYEYIKKKNPDVQVRLVHARTSAELKKKTSAEIVDLYGKQGKKTGLRPEKSIVISTQILEQSMDVDFDTLITELAPIDYIFQRDGRRMRHDDKGTIRKKSGYISRLIILTPKEGCKDVNLLPYHPALMKATEQVLSEHKEISIPEEIRPLINEVYRRAGKEWIDSSLQQAYYAKASIISSPSEDSFAHSKAWEISRKPITRYAEFPTVNLLLLDERDQEENISYDRAKWLIANRAVGVPAYLIPEDLSVEGSKSCKWLSDYVVLDKKAQDRVGIVLDETLGLIINGK